MKLKVIGGYHDGRIVYVRDGVNAGDVWDIAEDTPAQHCTPDAKVFNDCVNFHSYVVARRAEIQSNGYKREWLVLEDKL